MFINFSNHRTENWGEEQLAAAKRYGEIVDMPFPNVDPLGNECYISNLANEYVEKIVSMIQNPLQDVVHIMGELNLVFSVVSKLTAKGVTCVASTTERIVVEKVTETGELIKNATFKFCQFRAY